MHFRRAYRVGSAINVIRGLRHDPDLEAGAESLRVELQRRLEAGLMFPSRPIDDQRRALLRLMLAHATRTS